MSCQRGRSTSWEKVLVSETIELSSRIEYSERGGLLKWYRELPQVSVSLKNIMEEEEGFAKALCPHVRGGEAQVVGKDSGK